jgi:pimeloyl-ACP methyl ester carboxylesterase
MHRHTVAVSLIALMLVGGIAAPAAAQSSAARTRDVVRHDGVAIEVIREGRGPLIVLLPSLGRDSEEFDPIAAQMARDGFRVIRPRPRGFGRSVGPMEKITLHDFARDVAAAITEEKAGPAVIVGHAYGHLVARATATDFPALVRAVVLLGASQKNLDPEHRRWVTIAVDPSKPEAERVKYLQLMFFATGHDPRQWLSGFDPAVLRSQFGASDGTPQKEYWSAGTVPLFDLRGENDPSRPGSTANELVQEFGASRVTAGAIPNASHALIVEQPAAIATAVVAWVRRLPKP